MVRCDLPGSRGADQLEQLFAGATVSDSLAAVLTKEPDLQRVPSKFRNLVRLCLVKDVKLRLRDIGDARLILAGASAEQTAAPTPTSRSPWLPWAAAILFAGVALALSAAWLLRPAEPPLPLKLAVLPPENAVFTPNAPVVSPDGRRVLFVASVEGKAQLWVRSLDDLEPKLLPGTDGAQSPFWSPDSRFAAFFASGKLKKIDVTGGPPLTVCDTGQPRGGSWSRNDTIVFSPGPIVGLSRVPAAGGNPTPATELDVSLAEVSHRFPWFLPDGRHFLYLSRSSDPEKAGVYVGDLESKDRRRVITGLSNAMYVSPGFLVFMREQIVMVQPFDASRLQTTGDAFPVADHVDFHGSTSAGMFGVSQTGVLVYFSGGVTGGTQLTWFDRTGMSMGTVGPRGGMLSVSLSPDGGTAAVDRQNSQTGTFDIWLHDLVHRTDTRFTSDPGQDQYPFWSPDGSRVLFSSNRGGKWRLYQKPANGAGREEVFLETDLYRSASDWSHDGRYIVFEVIDSKHGADIWGLPDPAGSGARKPFPFLQSEFQETFGKLSPDGRWLAYISNQNNTSQVHVQSFPDKLGQWQISINGGSSPVWRRDGNELFYRAADGTLMAVDIKGGTKFEHGIPKPLFPTRLTPNPGNKFDVSPDGKRFLMIHPVEQTGTQRLNVVVNWLAGLKK